MLRLDASPGRVEVGALAPLEVERLVTFPVESGMAGLPDLDEIRSVSKFGLSAVTVVFKEGTDIYRARQLVQERMQSVREQLPEGVQPQLAPLSTPIGHAWAQRRQSVQR